MKSEDEMMEIALDAGAEDMQNDGELPDSHRAGGFPPVLDAIKGKGVEPISSEIAMIPQNTVKLDGAQAAQMLKLYDALDDHDDVQSVYANFEIDDAVLQQQALLGRGVGSGSE